MGSDVAAVPDRPEPVMTSIDSDGEREQLIIADLSCEGAWLAAPTSAARSLARWR